MMWDRICMVCNLYVCLFVCHSCFKGVESWTFYVKNLFLNFNFIFAIALLSPVICGLFNSFGAYCMCSRKRKTMFGKKRVKITEMFHIAVGGLNYRLLQAIAPLWIWYLFFSYMPHKEERFLFVIYPFIALNASLTLTQIRIFQLLSHPRMSIFKKILHWRWLKTIILTIFIVMCASRTIGQVFMYLWVCL